MTTNNYDPKKDQWTAEKYSAAAGFVPNLTQKVLQYLDPQPTDRILDVGCGDAKFTAHFIDRVAEVYGVDASASFIESATRDYGRSGGKAHFNVVDCRYLERDGAAVSGTWDKVVSNAALHWILRDPSTRVGTLRAIYAALRPGGAFVFEMGGAGNVADVHAALVAALFHAGVPMAAARDASPWFFPDVKWMRTTLEQLGFVVEVCELEYRPTPLVEGEGGGLEGWVRLMGASMLEKVEEGPKREEAVKEVCGVCADMVRREDGTSALGYVRLRGIARKPA